MPALVASCDEGKAYARNTRNTPRFTCYTPFQPFQAFRFVSPPIYLKRNETTKAKHEATPRDADEAPQAKPFPDVHLKTHKNRL